MKTLWHTVAVISVAHMLVLVGLAAFLIGTDRVNRERLAEAAELFRLTVPEQQAREDRTTQTERDAAEHAQRAEEAAGVETTPGSAAQRLAREQQENEMTLRRLERTRQEIESLRRNLQLAKKRADKQRKELQAKQEALNQRLKELRQRKNKKGFQRSVRLYESLPADQVKAMFLQLMDQGKTEQVVSYLEQMQARIAADVLEAFEGANVERAVELTERLRQRGTNLTANLGQGEAG